MDPERGGDDPAGGPVELDAVDVAAAPTVPARPRRAADAPAATASDTGGEGTSAPGVAGLAPGTRLGRYVVEDVLGQGGMGAVYAARDPSLDRRVAIKILHERHADQQIRLLREGQAVARLRHPNIVTVHDVGADGDALFVAMELVEGGTLRAWLRDERPWRDVLARFVPAGRGLAAAHAAGLVHRDFKPDNVLLGDDGRIVVTDFGLARAVEPAPGGSGSLDLSITRTGATLGTPRYMSPEQFRGEPAGARSDQFSFCVALWEALHGAPPFAGGTFEGIRDAVLAGRLEAPRRRVPARVQRAVARGLALAPDDRHPSMDALLAAVGPPRWRRAAIAGGLAAVAIGGTALALALRGGAAPGSACAAEVTARLDPIWTAPSVHLARGAGHEPSATAAFDRYAARWRDARLAVCRDAADPVRQALAARQATCLDADLDAFDRAIAAPTERVGQTVLAPSLPALRGCQRDHPRREPVVTTFERGGYFSTLSPTGDRIATVMDHRLLVYTLDHHQIGSFPVPDDVAWIHWVVPDRIVFVRGIDGSPFYFVDLGTGAVTSGAPLPDGEPTDDLGHVLGERADGTVYDQELATGRSRDLGHVANRISPILYSPDRRLVMGDVYGAADPGDDYDVIDVASGRTTRFVLPLDNRVSGVRSEHWLDERHVMITAENGLDAGEGLWSFDATDPSAAPEQILAAPPDTSYTVAAIVGERALGTRSTRSADITWQEGASVPTPSGVTTLGGITADGRMVVRRLRDAGWITPAGAYQPVGQYTSIAADGDRVLVADHRAISAVDAKLHVTTVAPVPSGWRNTHLSCGPAPGRRCIVWSRMGQWTEVRPLDQLERPIRFQTNETFWTLTVAADGRHVLVADRDHFDRVDLVSGRSDVVPLPEAGCTAQAVVAHGPGFVAALSCDDDTHLWEVPLAGPARRIGETRAAIMTFAAAADGHLLRLDESFDQELVIYDGI